MFTEGFKISRRIGISFFIVLLLSMTAIAAGVYQLGELSRSVLVDERQREPSEHSPTTLDKHAYAPGHASLQDMKDSAAATSAFMLTFGLMAVLAGIGLSMWLVSSIVHPLAEAIHIAETVKSGDLSQEFESERVGEFGRLLRGLGDMEDKLTDVVTEIRKSSDSMMVASTQVAMGNRDLSARTRQLAGSLEKTVVSVGELTARVKQNSAGAQRAHALALSTSALAAQGGSDVKELGETMDDMIASSRKIVEIVSVIDSIAFQTNILALNAAVEAARAGENGRGFAVVAGEVRNLAQRSALAAKEIKALIEDAAGRVDEGHERALNAGRKINEIVSSVQGVTEIVADINSACADQTAEIEQINQVIAQMDKVTRQNAALVEQAATSAAALQDDATALAQVVNTFKLDPLEPIDQAAFRGRECLIAPARAVLVESNTVPLIRQG